MALVRFLEWFFIAWMVLMLGGRVLLHFLALPALLRGVAIRPFNEMPAMYSGFDPPVSVIVPARDAQGSIADTVRSLLALDYPEFEVIVVNDGSADGTLAALQEAFQLEPFPEALWRRIPSAPVRTIYQSSTHSNLRVVDKEQGGRADALNAGINASRFPLFCVATVDAHVERNALLRMIEPFLENPAMLFSVMPMRLGDGDFPRGPLALLQRVEALPALFLRRLGWNTMGALVAMPGDFVVLRKDAVVEANGFRVGAECEEAELVVRLHAKLRARGERYSSRLGTETVAWIDSHVSMPAIVAPRMRWQHGLFAGLRRNSAIFAPRSVARDIALPLHLALECYGPVVETAAYVFMVGMWAAGFVPGATLLGFLALTVSLGFLVSSLALFLETLSSDQYPRLRHLAALASVALVQNLGFRQGVTAARALALLPIYRPRA